jgi:hypothetical protein
MIIAAKGSCGWFVKQDAVDCFKRLWLWDCDPPDAVAIRECNQRRFHCSGFRRHRPGRSPEQHLRLEDEDRDFHRKLIQTAITAILAFIGAVLGAWLGVKYH